MVTIGCFIHDSWTSGNEPSDRENKWLELRSLVGKGFFGCFHVVVGDAGWI
jgi:hypothetical protein